MGWTPCYNIPMKTIAVIFGGKSAEHDVSIITAHIPIIQSLLAAGGFNIVPVYIAKNGCWYSDPAMNDLEFFKQPDFENMAGMKENRLLFAGARENSFATKNPPAAGLKLIVPASGAFAKEKIFNIDIVFPAMHGTFGEDGSLMGLLRMAGVPFVGCDMAASAVAMDKVFTKQVLAAEKIPVVPYVWFSKSDWAQNKAALAEKIARLHHPLFVKPVHLGSSIGITKIKTAAELENAIEVALHYDDKVLVEEGIENLIEVTLPIMGNDDVLTFGNIERPLNKAEFFDFYDKYIANAGGNKQIGVGGGANSSAASAVGVNSAYSELPAKIPDALAARVRELGGKTYKILGCSGIARVDFLIDMNGSENEMNGSMSGSRTGSMNGSENESAGSENEGAAPKVYVNEVNTLPGSLYHHNWRSVGISGVDLVTRLIALAEQRFAAQKLITYTFKSEILNKIGGAKQGN